MTLSGHYDEKTDALAIWTGQKEADGSSAECDPPLAVFMGTKDGHDIVGFEVTGGAGPYLRMEEGYDAQTDTLTIGDTASDPAMITENEDLVAYWKVDDLNPEGFMDPIGVAIRNARKNLARIKILQEAKSG